MKKLICYLLGHKWRPYKGEFLHPYCARCGKHTTLKEILEQAGDKS